MKFATISQSLVLCLALLLASMAFAASKGNLQIGHAVTINGTTLKPGDYRVQWDGAGSDVQVIILLNNKVVTKASAHVVDLSTPASHNAAVTQIGSDGSSSLAGIRFEGKKFALQFGDSGSSDNLQSGSSK
jgi:S1-C subfamily serine protease